MTIDENTLNEWIRLIRSEYLEMPGLRLTKPEMQRLWRLEPHVCDTILNVLLESHFLKKSGDYYVLAPASSERERT
jgi:hypothetical protein